MTKKDIAKNQIISALIERDRRFSEIKKITKLKDMTLSRYLNSMVKRHIIMKTIKNNKIVYTMLRMKQPEKEETIRHLEQHISDIKYLRELGFFLNKGINEKDIRKFLLQNKDRVLGYEIGNIKSLEEGKLTYGDFVAFQSFLHLLNHRAKIKIKISIDINPMEEINKNKKGISFIRRL